MNSFRSKTHIWGNFTPFWCCTMSVWFRTTYFMSKTRVWVISRPFVAAPGPLWKSVSGAFNARVYASRTISCFLQQTWPIHYIRSKTLVLDGSAPFRCRTRPAAKISIGVHLKLEFVPRKPFLVWSQRTCSIHNFRSKTHVTIMLDTSMHFYIAFDDS